MLIKQRMISAMPDISRLIDRLICKDLVSRTQNEKDKRSVNLIITKKGLELLEELETDMMLHDVLLENLTEEEATTLNNLLDKLRGKEKVSL